MKSSSVVFAFLVFALFGCSNGLIPKDDFAPISSNSSPDYRLKSSWSALPTMKDSADVTPAGLIDNQALADVDVFFIHPTTYRGKQWNASLDDEKTNLKTDSKPVKYQATIFNGSCKVYAPRYRQATLQSFYKKRINGEKALDFAYEDVKKAFQYYLENYNNGRPFILATHSQGTRHGVRLMKELVDGQQIQELLVVAYLVGFSVPSNSFAQIPICETQDQFNCYATWSTYQKGFLPKSYETFYQNNRVVNPVSWKTEDNWVSKDKHKGSVLKNLKKVEPNLFETKIHNNILWITKPDVKGKLFLLFKNYHIGDYNLFYQDIRENVALRISSYINMHAAE